MKKKLFGCMMAAVALLTASCSGDLLVEAAPDNGAGAAIGGEGEEVEVTFSVSSESVQTAAKAPRRAGDEEVDFPEPKGPGAHQRISKGEAIDMLVYALYEKEVKEDKTVQYNLLTQYGSKEIPAMLANNAALKNYTVPDGQTICYVGDKFPKRKSFSFTLRLMRNREYYIALWAQSSKTTAYDTKSLEKVIVNYKDGDNGALNNDELRDAFCKVESFTVGSNEQENTRSIILYRPFAQINVGTTGADYNNFVSGEKVFPNREFTWSKIELKGVAQYLDVVRNEIDATTANLTDVTYEFNKIPANINVDELVPEADATTSTQDDAAGSSSEEYLIVKLNDDGNTPLGYKENYPTIDTETGKYLTETFKYLSMCYVLVPASKQDTPTEEEVATADEGTTDNSQSDATYNSSTLSSVSVYFAASKQTEDGADTADEVDTSDGYYANAAITLSNVPVHRNWRTNILGGLSTTSEDHPEDDNSSIFRSTKVCVNLDPTIEGDYNSTDVGDTWVQNKNGGTTK